MQPEGRTTVVGEKSSRIVRQVVISLPDSPRREGFQAQPEARDFIVFDAIDNRDGSFSDHFDAVRFEERFGRPPRPAEIGCTLSHLEVMRMFAESPGRLDDVMLVMEDDARCIAGLGQPLADITRRMPENSLVVLADPYGPAGRRDRSESSRSEHFVQLSWLSRRVSRLENAAPVVMGRWAAGLTGMGAYLVTRQAAQRVTQAVEGECRGRPWWVADYHGFYRDHLGVDVLAVRPNLVGWEGESSVQSPDHAQWRSGGEEMNGPGCRVLPLRTRIRRLRMQAQSTKFDLGWRVRHRRSGPGSPQR